MRLLIITVLLVVQLSLLQEIDANDAESPPIESKPPPEFTKRDCVNSFPGPCRAAIPRWRWDLEQNQCVLDSFGGCNATLNNFETKQECENVALPVCAVFVKADCLKDVQSDEYPVCEAHTIRWKWDDTINNCVSASYGGCNPTPNNFRTQQECIKVATPVCYKKCKPKFKVKDCENGFPGPCKAQMPRWRWDIEENQCILDIYGGCQPTPNNFETKQQCENVALPVCAVFEKDDCLKGVESDEYPHCLALIERWTWDNKQGKCVNATYGGCNPTSNNFKTKQKCQKVAAPVCKEEFKTSDCYKDPGLKCKAKFEVWAWSVKDKACTQQIYGGCEPTNNNFKTKAQCEKIAGPVCRKIH